MAMTPRISAPPQFAAKAQRVPAALQNPLVDGLGQAAKVAGQMIQIDEQVSEQIADSEFRIARHEEQQADNQLSLKQSAALAAMQGRIIEMDAAARENADPSGAGYEAAINAAVDKEISAFDAGFGQNERVRQRFMDNVAQLKARTGSQAKIWAMERQGTHQRDTAKLTMDTLTNTIRLGVEKDGIDTTLLAGQLSQADTLAMAFPPAMRGEVAKVFRGTVLNTTAEAALTRGDVAQVRAAYEGGMLNEIPPQAFEQLGQRIGNEEKALMLRREAEASAARQAATEDMNLLQRQLEAGIDPGDIDVRVAAAMKAGVKVTELFDVSAAKAKLTITRQFKDMNASGTQSYVDGLWSKVKSGKANAEEQLAYQHLKDLPDQKRKKEAADNKELWESGDGGQAQIIAQLDRLPPLERARQAEKYDPALRMAINLRPEVRTLARIGMAARKADPTRVPADKARDVYRRFVSTSTAIFGTTENAAMMEGAMNIYAGVMSESGLTEFSEERFQNAIQRQLGARKVNEKWVGGIGVRNGRKVVLPPTYNEADFDTMLARTDWTHAVLNGKSVTKADILRYFTPEFRGEVNGQNTYWMTDDQGKRLWHKAGAPFMLMVQP